MKPHKHARLALKALHQAGQEKKRIKRIIPDISSAIEKISDIKGDDKPTWKNALWRFVSQFSECDAIQLVKIYEQSVKSSKPRKDKPEDKSVKEKPVKDKEQLRREKREREEKKKRHRAELKRQYELSQKQGTSGQSGQQSRQSEDKRSKDERKRKHQQDGRYRRNQNENSYEKYRRMGDFDPPSAPSMF